MKKYILIATALLCMAACKEAPKEQKVMARHVPERMDDFVFENNLIAGRIYGEALEGNPTGPGVDIWVKMPGKLVADQWYAAAQEDPEYYHHNHGDGKDCYKVSTTLGGGASCILVNGEFCKPATNWRSYEILEQSLEKVVFVLNYPEWEAYGEKIALSKKITVVADSYFCKVEDSYTFSGELGDSLDVACGIFRHPEQETIEQELASDNFYAIWEHASDQSIEPEDGMLGVAVVLPDNADYAGLSATEDHGLCVKRIKSGDPFTYWFGSCWSKADIKTASAWFEQVEEWCEQVKM